MKENSSIIREYGKSLDDILNDARRSMSDLPNADYPAGSMVLSAEIECKLLEALNRVDTLKLSTIEDIRRNNGDWKYENAIDDLTVKCRRILCDDIFMAWPVANKYRY